MAYCILEHLAKQNLDPKATTNLLMKEFAAIVFSVGEILDKTSFYDAGNVKERHIRLINKIGLAIGSYTAISEAQLDKIHIMVYDRLIQLALPAKYGPSKSILNTFTKKKN